MKINLELGPLAHEPYKHRLLFQDVDAKTEDESMANAARIFGADKVKDERYVPGCYRQERSGGARGHKAGWVRFDAVGYMVFVPA